MKRKNTPLLLLFALLLTACAGQAVQEAGVQPPADIQLITPGEREETYRSDAAPVSDELTLAPEDEVSEEYVTSELLPEEEMAAPQLPVEGAYYYDLENVALYLELYGALPDNYVTKREARALGWSGGSVERYREGAAIGGDRFGNREGQLPAAKGRTYTECDLNTDGSNSRGAERLVFSSDGLYFYTGDHYEHFTEYIVTQDWEVIPA